MLWTPTIVLQSGCGVFLLLFLSPNSNKKYPVNLIENSDPTFFGLLHIQFWFIRGLVIVCLIVEALAMKRLLTRRVEQLET